MKIKGYFVFLLFISFVLIGCKQKKTDNELANKYLNMADSLYRLNRYEDSKVFIDSINLRYPMQVDIRQKADIILEHIKLIEQEKLMLKADSIRNTVNFKLKRVLFDFVLEKNSKYQSEGSYRYRTQSDEFVLGKTLIKPMVSENGNIVMESIYNGVSAIHHTSVKFYCLNNIAISETVNYTDGNSFIIDGKTTEMMVFYNVTKLINLVRNNLKSDIKVTLIGNKNITYTLSLDNKNAINKAFELSELLKEIHKQNLIISISKKKIQLYQSELAEHD